MLKNFEEVRKLITRCLQKVMDEDCVEPFIRAAGWPRAASDAARYLWIDQTPEDDDTRELRRQLYCLNRYGYFCY